MGFKREKLRAAATLLTALTAVQAQGSTNSCTIGTGPDAAGPAWIESEYDSSPPVYPTPNATGYDWAAAFAQASNFVNQLTLAEKAQIVTGTPGPCVGNIGSIPRLGFSGLCLQDGPLAIRQATYASVFPAGLSVAASWDVDLARQRGVEMAQEFKGKGAHVALGPVAGPLGRSGKGGRNWEGFSPDPVLTGNLFSVTIEGMQSQGLQACAKHYIAYEQETQRNPSVSAEGITIEAVSSNLDDRTMHELYLWPFQDAVKSGVASVMCSYNRINGSYACQNSKTLNGLLKEELGFQGYVMSDWEGTHSGWPAADAGLDLNMPGGIGFVTGVPSFFGPNITQSVNNGSLSIDRVDDMCRRIMTPYFYLGQNSGYPPVDGYEPELNFFPLSNYAYNFTLGPANVDVRDDHEVLIRELGAAGIVLLKNENNALPLKTPMNIAVFGNDAGDDIEGLYYDAIPNTGDVGFKQGVLASGGGSGTGRFSFLIPPLQAIKNKVASYNGKALVQYVLDNEEITSGSAWPIIQPQPPDVCLVFLKTWATEGYDRLNLDVDWHGNNVTETIAAHCSNTIVITNSGGLNVLPWANNPNVTAILAAHYPGEEVGNSIVDVLWGDVNPSGKLPYTIAYEACDYDFAPIVNSTALQDTEDPNAWQSNFEERLLIDYRHFDYFNISVQYPFGYGLSYTSFSMSSNLAITPLATSTITALPANQPIVPGGNPALFENLYSVSVTISNTGSVPGAAVPQIYLGLPQPANEDYTPVKVLRAFDKVFLQPGESRTLTFDLTRRDISYWDRFVQSWVIGDGDISVMAGFSSRDIYATGSFQPLSGGGSGKGNGTSSSSSGSSTGSASVSGTGSVGSTSLTSGIGSSTSYGSVTASSASMVTSTLMTPTGPATTSGNGWSDGWSHGGWGSHSWPSHSSGQWGPPKA